jgi:hypothetical protein
MDPYISYSSSFFFGREERLHRQSLPPEPKTFKELENHPFEPRFKQATETQMNSLWDHGTSSVLRETKPLNEPCR